MTTGQCMKTIDAGRVGLALCAIAAAVLAGCASAPETAREPRAAPTAPATPTTPVAAPAPAPAAQAAKPRTVRAVEPGEFDKLRADKSLETWFLTKVLVTVPVRRGGFYTVCESNVFVPVGTDSLPASVERQIVAASGMADRSGELILRAGSTLIANPSRSLAANPREEMRSIGMALVSPQCGGRAVVYQ